MQVLTNLIARFRPNTVRTTAKDRMRSMLTYDRLELPAGRLECLEEELMSVVSRYFELDKSTTQFDLQQYDRRAQLVANFPLLRSKC
jgi:cell division topological specificity factor